MRYQDFSDPSMIINWLVRVKEEALRDVNAISVGGCGSFVVAHYVDKCVSTLLEQQTYIAELEHKLEYEREENKEYRDRYGDLDELPEDDTEESFKGEKGERANAEIHQP